MFNFCIINLLHVCSLSCAGPDKDMLGTLGHRFMDNRECECGGECYRCCVTFELNVKFEHDENPGQLIKLVTSKDLKPHVVDVDKEFGDVLPCHFSNENDREQAQDEGKDRQNSIYNTCAGTNESCFFMFRVKMNMFTRVMIYCRYFDCQVSKGAGDPHEVCRDPGYR